MSPLVETSAAALRQTPSAMKRQKAYSVAPPIASFGWIEGMILWALSSGHCLR